METVEILVEGGKATPGPPLGPALGPLGVNVKEVVNKINELTKDFEGMKVPVKVIVDKGKVDIKVGIPPVSSLIKKELGIDKAKRESPDDYVGDISLKKVIEITNKKKAEMLSYSLKKAVKEVLGTCLSMGVKVEGKNAKEIIREIEEGKYDDILS